MALFAKSFEEVKKMNPEQRTLYFEEYAGYFEDSPSTPYAIRVGGKTFFAEDTLELRQKFDKYLRYKRLSS